MKNNFDLKHAVKTELVEVLFKNLSIGLIGIFLMASIVTWQLRDEANANYIFIWYLCLSFNMLLGFFLIFWYSKTKNNTQLLNYHFYLYFVGSTLTAILLGIIASVLMPEAVNKQVLVIIMIVCITSGSIQSLHSSYLASFSYLIAAILPLLFWEGLQYLQGNDLYLGLFVATIFYTFYLIAEVYRGHETIINNITLKIENIKSNEELRKQKNQIEFLSKHDPITNLFNRRYLEEISLACNKNLLSENMNFSVFMFDIDHFKNINDVFGHEIGDIVLKNLGILINQYFKGTSMSFRYGGEEFLIILEGLTLEEAFKRALEFQSHLKINTILPNQFSDSNITISGGVAAFSGSGKDIYSVIKEADKALYKAKKQGRNRIVVSQHHLVAS